ncbi:MAG: SMC-Scp complex subunit ScpB [Alphaproteobacteria bacterium]|nr:SMC-Scp complex subunit ScpB [Alphaproteobacteria bacterium]
MTGDNVVPFPGESRVPPEPVELDPDELESALEALLFAAGEPVTVAELAEALGLIDHVAVRDGLHGLAQASVGRGVRVLKVAGGWQMRTDARFADAILRLRGGRPATMSKAALEALAVVAYRQPVTRTEVDEIRGVSSGGVLKTLLDKGYLRVVGRRDEPGRPLEYGTTAMFLDMFELPGLDALPTLREREELAGGEEDARVEVDVEVEVDPELEVDLDAYVGAVAGGSEE